MAKKELIVQNKTDADVKQVSEVDSFITLALTQKAPIETLEKLFALQKDVKAEQAKSAFVEAHARFQSQCPVIEKTKIVMNKDGRTIRYKFAPIDSIVEQTKKLLADNGLAYTWTIENQNGTMTAQCKVTHVMGHSESSSFTIPIDMDGFMTAPQKYASAQTFAKRYALCNALGIATGEEDTDASDVKKEAEPKDDKSKIMFLLRRLNPEIKNTDVVAKIQELTQLEPTEVNRKEVIARLEILVAEKESYDNNSNV